MASVALWLATMFVMDVTLDVWLGILMVSPRDSMVLKIMRTPCFCAIYRAENGWRGGSEQCKAHESKLGYRCIRWRPERKYAEGKCLLCFLKLHVCYLLSWY